MRDHRASAHESNEIVRRSFARLNGGPAEIMIGVLWDFRDLGGIPRNPDAAHCRRCYDGGTRAGPLDEGDIDAVLACTVDEVSGSIEGIDEKEEIVGFNVAGGLLGDHRHSLPGSCSSRIINSSEARSARVVGEPSSLMRFSMKAHSMRRNTRPA